MSSVSEAGELPLILIPVHNDWTALGLLLNRLDEVLEKNEVRVDVVVIDDGSTELPADGWVANNRCATRTLRVLTLRSNLGHQRALAVGLAYAEANIPCAAVVVMDGDGEDAPEDVPRMIRHLRAVGGDRIVFAERTKRSEGWLFRTLYMVYRGIHRVLTGVRVPVGNFSVIPRPLLSRLVVMSDLWNHYAASVYKSRIPLSTLPTPRGKRLAGQTRMNLVSLIIHGLSAISVFSDRIGVRLIIAVAGMLTLVVFGLITVVAIRLTTDWAIPGWATSATGLLLVILLQGLLMMVVFIMIVLNGRNGQGFLPVRDHPGSWDCSPGRRTGSPTFASNSNRTCMARCSRSGRASAAPHGFCATGRRAGGSVSSRMPNKSSNWNRPFAKPVFLSPWKFAPARWANCPRECCSMRSSTSMSWSTSPMTARNWGRPPAD